MTVEILFYILALVFVIGITFTLAVILTIAGLVMAATWFRKRQRDRQRGREWREYMR
jgi:uncharacterized membrane protein HdeD (DUF308 family)